MKIVDLEHWSRREHYLFFRKMDFPHYNIGVDLDITCFLAGVKERSLAFSFAMTYAASAVMNEVEAFRYRIQEDRVILHERIHPSFSYLAPGDEYFKMVIADLGESMADFVVRAREKALTQKKHFPFEEVGGRSDLIYISSIPWVSFTHLTHTISLDKSDAVPRLAWGKYYREGDRTRMPFNLQAHHSFVDGNHAGEYFERLQRFLDAF